MWTNLRFIPIRKHNLEHFHPAGFLSKAKKMCDFIIRCTKPDDSIVLTGHSLGGAVAILTANLLEQSGRQVAEAVVFGAPKVGFCHHMDCVPLWQYKYRGDIVTTLGFLGHPSEQIVLGKERWFPRLKDHSMSNYVNYLNHSLRADI
jgi:putative lipase involved disintegration of autophagic bodies